MNTISKKILSLLLCFSMLFGYSISVSALTVDYHDYNTNTFDEQFAPIVTVDEDNARMKRAPNHISWYCKTSKHGLKVYIENIGVDPLDEVKATVSATGYTGYSDPIHVNFGSVLPIIPKSHFFKFPMIKCNMDYKIGIVFIDGGEIKFKHGHASIEYTEEKLGYWNKGTFDTRVESVDYHFEKHHNNKEVKVDNIPDYLKKAYAFAEEVYEDMENLTPRDFYQTYNVTDCSREKGIKNAKKYTNKVDRRYIMLAPDKTIISFGGKEAK